MAYLGVDYGSKKVGLAYSDETNSVAFPLTVIRNDASLLGALREAAEKVRAVAIIMGESKNFAGADNPVMENAARFAKQIETALKLPVYWEPEFLTSREAQRSGGEPVTLDASAAALILQSFLDRQKTNDFH